MKSCRVHGGARIGLVKNQEEVTRRLAGSKRYSNVDLLKGFHQMRLTERASLLLAVITSLGMYLPVTAPFGFHALPSHFQFVMSHKVLKGLDTKGVESFVDDILAHGRTFAEMIGRLREVFVRLRYWNLRINGKKTTLGSYECVFLLPPSHNSRCFFLCMLRSHAYHYLII